MRRSFRTVAAAMLFVVSMIPLSPIAMSVPMANAKDSTSLATPEEAAKVNDSLKLFFKRVNSSKPDVLHRAWTQMTANGQKVMFFPGDEQYFAPAKSKLLQSGDVTVNASSGFDVEVILSGLWTVHGLWHGTISLTGDYLIDNFVVLDPVVPNGKSSISLNVDLTGGTASVDQTDFVRVDVILISFSNQESEFQRVELDRLETGQTVDDLAGQMATFSQDTYASTGMMPGKTQKIALIGVKPGTYVIASFIGGTATTSPTILASTIITITS